MDDQTTNPYSPPATTSERPQVPPPQHSSIPAQLVSVATLAYIIFTGMNLASSSVDQQAGRLLLLNVPVLLMWSGTLWATLQFGLRLGLLAIGIQCLIMLIMLTFYQFDTEPVIFINGLIIGIMAALAATCHRFVGRNKEL